MFTTLYGPSVVRNLESELFSTEKLRCHSKCPDSALSTSIANHTSNNHGVIIIEYAAVHILV